MPEVQQLEKHCVFQCGPHWFAAPAASVREIVPRPRVVAVPASPTALFGLCHWRNEFVPVVSLLALLGDDSAADASAAQLLVMDSTTNSPWAIPVDDVATLAVLDVSINTDGRSQDNWSTILMGSATCSGEVVRVLDVNAIYRLASRSLVTAAAADPPLPSAVTPVS